MILTGESQARVVTAKCSDPQACISNEASGGSGVVNPKGLLIETGYKAKWRIRLL